MLGDFFFKTRLSFVAAQRPMYTGERTAVVSPLWGRSGEAPGDRLYNISMYITCVHLLNIYRNISQNNTISYSNNELLSHNSKQLSSSSQFWKEVGGGAFQSLASLLQILITLSWSCSPTASPHTPRPVVL